MANNNSKMPENKEKNKKKEEKHKKEEDVFNFDSIKKLSSNLTIYNIFKYFLFFLFLIIGVSIIVALIKFIIFSAKGFYPSSVGYYGAATENWKSLERASFYPTAAAKPATVENYLEKVNYYVLIKTNNKNYIIKEIKKKEDYRTVIIENLREFRGWAYLTVKVKKEKAKEFLNFLKQFNIDEISTNTQKITQYYSNLDDKLKLLEKRKKELLSRLEKIKADYQELIKLAKEKNDIETLNKIYDSLNSKENVIWKEIFNIDQQIFNIKKQLNYYENEDKYVIFNINIQEEKIIDFKIYKEQWINSLKDLANNFNTTLKAICLGVPNLLLTAVRFVIFFFISAVIGLLTLKALWKVGRKILKV